MFIKYQPTTTTKFLLVLTASLIFSGCSSLHAGAKHLPIVDGGDLTHYETDLAQCQQVAKQREFINDETKQEAVIGALFGAVLGLGGDKEDIIGGAVAGATIGAADGAFDARTERKNIVINCMRNRGYNTVESTGYHS